MKIFNAQRVDNLPEGILFDTDNTLYDYTPAHEAALDAVCKKIMGNLSLPRGEFIEAFDEARRQIKAQLGNTASSLIGCCNAQWRTLVLGLIAPFTGI